MVDAVVNHGQAVSDAAVYRLRVLAHTPSAWSPWVEALATALEPAAPHVPREESPPSRWQIELGALGEAAATAPGPGLSGHTRWALLVDPPSRYLAERLADDHCTGPADLLNTWQAMAVQALAQIHQLRSHCIVFDTEEALSSPAAVAQSLSGWLGVDLPEDGLDMAPPQSTLLLKLARAYTEADRRVMALWSELQACCMPLPGLPLASESGIAQPSALEVLAEAQGLMAAAAQLPALQSKLSELRLQLEQARHAAERVQVQQADQLRAAEAQASDARAESEMLLGRLRQAQEALQVQAQQQEQAVSTLGRTQADLLASQQEAGALRALLQTEREATDALKARLDAAQQQADSEQRRASKLAQEHQDVLAQMAGLRQQAAQQQEDLHSARRAAEHALTQQLERTQAAETQASAAQAEAELLLAQLHLVQEELEALFLQQQANASPAQVQAELESAQRDATGLREQVQQARQQSANLAAELAAAQQRIETLGGLEARFKAEQQRLEQARHDAERALAQQAAKTQAAEARVGEVQTEANLLLAQLHQVQEELESLCQQRQADTALATAQAELQLAQQEAAALRAELQLQRQQTTALSEQLGAARQRAGGTETEREALSAQLDRVKREFMQERDRLLQAESRLEAALRAERAAREQAEAARSHVEAERNKSEAALGAQVADAREEANLLLVQLHHVQEELEAHFLALQSARQELQTTAQAAAQAAQEAAAIRAGDSGPGASAREVRITGMREQPPHCELNLQLTDVRVGADMLPKVLARLVEHEGRVGLALLATPDVPTPITQWAPDGEEAGRAYMLFIPADAVGRERMAQLGTRNWLMLKSLAELVRKALLDGSVDAGPHWQTVASRLCVELQALPARLRYDEMKVRLEGDTVAVDLEHVCFGDSPLPPVSLRWTPGGGQMPLRWLRTDERKPCLATWPVQADGMLATELVLPVAGYGSLGTRMRWWTSLPPADRELALAAVDTLAAAVQQLASTADAAQLSRWGTEAARLHGEIRRTLNLGRVARRLRHGI